MEREFKVTPVLTRFDNPEISLSVVDLKGVGRFVANSENTAVYVCVKGKVTFALKRHGVVSLKPLKEGERIKIPPETPYLDFSKDGATLIAINKKAFDPAQVIEYLVPEKLMRYLEGVGLT